MYVNYISLKFILEDHDEDDGTHRMSFNDTASSKNALHIYLHSLTPGGLEGNQSAHSG